MRVLLVALLAAISYAQTASIIDIPTEVQDGTTTFVGICSIIEENSGTCSALGNQCVTAYCRESDNACFTQGKEYGTPCTTSAADEGGVSREIRGVCVDGDCIWSADAGECPDPILSAERTFISCGNAGFSKTWRFVQGNHCLQTGSSCQDVSAQMSNLVCTTSQTRFDDEHEIFTVRYMDNMGTPDDPDDDECIIGESDTCKIFGAGSYSFSGMEINWSGTVETDDEVTTRFEIPYTTKNLTPRVYCPSGACRGTVQCDMIGPEPCGRVVETCDGTYSPSASPIVEPLEPTTTSQPETTASSHGDPIIWTFFGEVYDLHEDGIFLASSSPEYDHDVYISVHNNYMREIQVVDKSTGILRLSINNMGDVIKYQFPFHFEQNYRKCEPHQENECTFFYKEFKFDAQDFEYVVQIHPHDYLDPALQEGEAGVHLDIYPRPFDSFKKNQYSGLYFHNPLPEECEL